VGSYNFSCPVGSTAAAIKSGHTLSWSTRTPLDNKPLQLLKSLVVALILIFQMFYCLLTPFPKKKKITACCCSTRVQFESSVTIFEDDM
jgi:hypothetical protein